MLLHTAEEAGGGGGEKGQGPNTSDHLLRGKGGKEVELHIEE